MICIRKWVYDMLINDDIECLNNIVKYSNDMIEGKKDIEEYYDDILKELLILKGYNKNKVYEFIGCGDSMRVLEEFGRDCISNEMNRRYE